MCCKILLPICAILCFVALLEAASLRRDTYIDSAGNSPEKYSKSSGENNDHQNIIKRQLAHEQKITDSQNGFNGDGKENNGNDENDSSYVRRHKRNVTKAESSNEIVENVKPTNSDDMKEQPTKQPSPATEATSVTAATTSAPASPNTSVLILIRDIIKKITTELPNTQQVAFSAQQYFQLFEQFLQQTIEQVIGDVDDEDDVEYISIVPEESHPSDDKDKEFNNTTTGNSNKPNVTQPADKESSAASEATESSQPEKEPEPLNENKS